ncbi:MULTISPECIES: hypothetical protein [unclassified Lentimonas]|uniref:hypothetical protein n=1 Tax=unclassified Lentimonas TaxID=2630993 RepID=UPI001389759E|nr:MULTISPECIES: hypothetical protein [unclassified Lentimonas]
MKTIIILSFMAMAGLLSASEYVVEKFNPPIHFNGDGFKEECVHDWATAFLGRKAPGAITFTEFNQTISEAVKKKFGLDETAYGEMVQRKPKSEVYGSILAAVTFNDENEAFMMLILYPTELSQYPQSKDEVSGFISKLFFKKQGDRWISWMMPHDMAYDDPITNIDPKQALGLE